MRMNTTLRSAVIFLLAAIPLAACNRSHDNSDDAQMFTDNHGLLTVPASSPLRSHLVIQTVATEGAAQTIELPAVVEADPARVANILAPLTGRVVALKVALGDRVHKGQVLAILASGDLAQAYDDDDKARDSLNLATKALSRARGVHTAGAAADKDLEAAQSNYTQALAEATRARTRLLSLNGESASRTRQLLLTAPQSGVVTGLAVAAGATVTDPTATLMTVTNIDSVYVTANVAESDIGRIEPGANADIALISHPGQILHGKVAEVNATVEPDTRRQKVRIVWANADGRLMPNMFATVRIVVPSMGRIFLPQSALLMNNDTISVFVEVRPWVFQRRVVRIGDETDTTARALNGLAAGDRIIVRGGVLLND